MKSVKNKAINPFNRLPYRYYYSKMTGTEFCSQVKYSIDSFDDDSPEIIQIDSKYLPAMIDKLRELYIDSLENLNFVYQDLTPASSRGYYRESNKTLSIEQLDKILKNHLLGIKTAGCCPSDSEKQKWFIFDVDVGTESNGKNDFTSNQIFANRTAQKYTKKLIALLSEYIPENKIYCYRSGTKGYHVAVYLEKLYNRQIIQKFQASIISSLDLPIDVIVEIFPYIMDTKTSGKTAKFPLGRNYKSSDTSFNFCCFVNSKTLSPVIKQENFFLNIKKASIHELNIAIKKASKNIKKTEKPTLIVDNSNIITDTDVSSYDVHKEIIDFLKGFEIKNQGVRHNIIFKIALHLKSRFNLKRKETLKYIIIWSKNNDGKFMTDYKSAIIDAKFQVNDVYNKNKKLFGSTSQVAYLSNKDIDFCLDIRNEEGKICNKELNAIKVMLSLICQAKMCKREQFFMSYTQIRQLIDIRRNYINPCLKRLEELGKIKIINRVDYQNGSREANEYYINLSVINDNSEKRFQMYYNKKPDIVQILEFFYNVNSLKEMLSIKIIRRISGTF